MKPYAVIVITWFSCVQVFAESITRDELIAAVMDATTIRPMFGLIVNKEESARTKSDLALYARGLGFVPDRIDDVPADAKQALLSRPLHLFGTDREYCRAQLQSRLMGMMRAAEIAKQMPMLTPAQENASIGQCDSLIAQVDRSIEKHLGSLINKQERSEYLTILRRTFARQMRGRLSYEGKRVLSAEKANKIAIEFEKRLADTKQAAFDRFQEDLPDAKSERYQRALKGLHDEIFGEMFSFLNERLGSATELPEGKRPRVETLKAEYKEAKAQASEAHHRVWDANRARLRSLKRKLGPEN